MKAKDNASKLHCVYLSVANSMPTNYRIFLSLFRWPNVCVSSALIWSSHHKYYLCIALVNYYIHVIIFVVNKFELNWIELNPSLLINLSCFYYTLSQLENDRDVSAYSGRRCLCVFSHVPKETQGLTHKECVLQRVSFSAISDVTVVLGMRQSIDFN